MPRLWPAAAILAVAACSPQPERISQAEITKVLALERPAQQLQQVHPVTVDGKQGFCGTAARIAARKSGQAEVPIDLFLYKDGRFHWASGAASDAALVETHCAGAIYTQPPRRR